MDRVTVFERGARVTRLARLPRAPGSGPPARVIAAGLPLGLVDDSVRVTARGATAISATVILEAAGADDQLPAALPEKLREARRASALAEGEVERLRRELEALESTQLVAEPSEHQPAAPWLMVATARRALLELRQTRMRELRLAMTEATSRAQDAARALTAAQEADRRSSTARSPRTGELRKSVVIELQADAPDGAGAPDGGAAAEDGGELELTLEYAVHGARWAPSYVARYAGGQLTWTIRAQLAQHTGEDWRGVALRVSTAALDGHSELPELAALKIGKRQQAVRRRLRPPPVGVDQLFTDFDRDLSKRSEGPGKTVKMARVSGAAKAEPAPPLEEMMVGGAPAPQAAYAQAPMPMAYADDDDEAYRDDTKVQSKKKRGVLDALAAKLPAGRASASMPAPVMMESSRAPSGYAPARGGAGGASSFYDAPPPPPAPEPIAELGFTGLVMAGVGDPRRGHLVEMSLVERYRVGDGLESEAVRRQLQKAQHAATVLEQSAVPAGHTGDWSHDFDYALEAEGRVDLLSDGAWHSLPLVTRSAAATVTHVAVPREATDVFRIATGENPFEAPILPGPVDVYDGDRFLVTAEAPVAAPGGELVLPLGVDPAIKLARNTEFREEVTGMLRGGLRLSHELRLEVQNTSAAPIELEVRERVPVPRQKDSDDIAVEIGAVQPPWHPWTPPPSSAHQPEVRGGYRWKIKVAARATVKLSAAYEVRIAGKHELVGGNRREP